MPDKALVAQKLVSKQFVNVDCRKIGTKTSHAERSAMSGWKGPNDNVVVKVNQLDPKERACKTKKCHRSMEAESEQLEEGSRPLKASGLPASKTPGPLKEQMWFGLIRAVANSIPCVQARWQRCRWGGSARGAELCTLSTAERS